MTRTNVTNWQDCETITRLCHRLIEALMTYNKYEYADAKGFGGDQSVMVEAITLRNRLNTLIDRSPH